MLKRFLLLALVLTSTNGHVFAESGENEDPNPFRAPQAPLLPTRDDERKWAWDYIQGLSTLTTEQASREFQEVLKGGTERKIMLRELEAMPYRFFCQLLHTDEYIGRNYRSVPPKEGLVGKLLAQLPPELLRKYRDDLRAMEHLGTDHSLRANEAVPVMEEVIDGQSTVSWLCSKALRALRLR